MHTQIISTIDKAEVDILISTAKAYPMHSDADSIKAIVQRVGALISLDITTAEQCYYRTYKTKRDGTLTVIEGPSIRLAELLINSWGNLRVGARLIANDGNTITVQGVCHDLETNVAVTKEVVKSIKTSSGNTYSQDMQSVTTNAAMSLAIRNAALSIIPKALTSQLKNVSENTMLNHYSRDVVKFYSAAVACFRKLGVSESQILTYLELSEPKDVTAAHIIKLKQAKTAIVDGFTTVAKMFNSNVDQRKATVKANQSNNPVNNMP